MSVEEIVMPKTWKEKLEELEINESCIVDKTSSVSMCIYRNFKNSEKEFSIRTDKKNSEEKKIIRVWRIK